MSKEQKVTLKEWLYITIGILIMTVGIYFFKFPNHFSTGGVTGIAIVAVFKIFCKRANCDRQMISGA